MTAKEIFDLASKTPKHLISFGIRTDDNEYNVGDDLPKSLNMIDDADEEYLDGTSATGFDQLAFYEEDAIESIEKALAINSQYEGKHQYIIAGTDGHYGDDEGEVIIEFAEVIGIIR